MTDLTPYIYRAGYRIAIDGGWPCTLGPIGYQENSPYLQVFLTNSHCTDDEVALDGGLVSQGTDSIFANNPDTLGFEIADPEPTSNSREADVALFEMTYFGGNYLSAFRIARTADSAHTSAASDSVDASIPLMVAWSQADDNTVNEELNKVGRTTGWTYGDVVDTCEDLESFSGWWNLCSDIVYYHSASGDSGAPVFKILGGTLYGYPKVEIRGIHWGRYHDTLAAISPLGQIEKDVGALELSVYPYDAIDVTIDGSSYVDENQNCPYEADVTGGKTPYTYAWVFENDTVGTSMTYWHEVEEDNFTLRAHVRDDYGFDDWADIVVTVDGDGDACPPMRQQ